jgi:hypothetical protein
MICLNRPLYSWCPDSNLLQSSHRQPPGYAYAGYKKLNFPERLERFRAGLHRQGFGQESLRRPRACIHFRVTMGGDEDGRNTAAFGVQLSCDSRPDMPGMRMSAMRQAVCAAAGLQKSSAEANACAAVQPLSAVPHALRINSPSSTTRPVSS